MDTILIVAYIYIGFVLGLITHKFMQDKCIDKSFWHGFSFMWIIDSFKRNNK